MIDNIKYISTIITGQLPHLLDKIDIILIASITLMGFMITSLSILKMIIPNTIENTPTLKSDILKMFKYSIFLLLVSSLLATIAFFFCKYTNIMQYVALLSFVLFLLSIYYIYNSIKVIFLLEDNN